MLLHLLATWLSMLLPAHSLPRPWEATRVTCTGNSQGNSCNLRVCAIKLYMYVFILSLRELTFDCPWVHMYKDILIHNYPSRKRRKRGEMSHNTTQHVSLSIESKLHTGEISIQNLALYRYVFSKPHKRLR